MTNNKNNVPLFVEEQIIQQKIKMPSNFIELKTVGKNYICSTRGWPKEPVCERYGFSANGKWIQLDIPQEIMTNLELELGKEINHPIYISPEVSERKPDEFGVTTIKNEREIIYQKEGIILVQEKEAQVDFTSGEITDLKQKLEKSEELNQETQKLLEKIAKDNEEKHIAIIFFEQQIKDLTQRTIELRRDLEQEILAKKREENKNRELERIIKKLKEDEQVLIGLQNNFTELQTELGNQITTLTIEKNRIQGELDNLKSKLKRTQKNFLGSIFRSGKKKQKITNLNIKILQLGAELTSKNEQIKRLKDNLNQLTTERHNLQVQVNNLNGTLRARDQTINNLNRDVNTWRNNYDNSQRELSDTKRNYESAQSNYNYYYGRYRDKDREVDNLNSQISSLKNENSRLQAKNIDNYARKYVFDFHKAEINTNFHANKGNYKEIIWKADKLDVDKYGINYQQYSKVYIFGNKYEVVIINDYGKNYFDND